MYIKFVEIQNFRKLKCIRMDIHEQKTLLVGANNSGKTSAMQCLSHFLVDEKQFTTNDFTLSNWAQLNKIGDSWMAPTSGPLNLAPNDWASVLPAIDIWLHVEESEIHHVRHLVPTLEWEGGLLGVRLRYEPKDIEELRKEYLQAIGAARTTRDKALAKSGKDNIEVALWPESMRDFLDRRLRTHFQVRAYTLDPKRCVAPTHGQPSPQTLPEGSEHIESNPFEGLVRIDEISAQRGFGARGTRSADEGGSPSARRDQRRLSDQLRSYYINHLDPSELPEAEDVSALEAIELAQKLFDDKLKDGFKEALAEIEGLGYPGISDPKLTIGIRVRPADVLEHDSAVRYEVSPENGEISASPLLLPEEYNGLGYQNLISMVFRLMSFRDAWMQVGKAEKRAQLTSQDALPPLHIVLVEEPEAHLHAQVQQVFIRKAYEILRKHRDLGANTELRTQLIVSTHSSHVAHECEFACLRYFRRLPSCSRGEVPTSTVVNLSRVFGSDTETQRFATRYLTAMHSDLFFADAAVFVEGSAERMLVPHFIRGTFRNLHQRYITLLEIGGSHAHRLRPLIDELGLTTLIITDIDPVSAETGHARAPSRQSGLVTGNPTLKGWHPEKAAFDELLGLGANDKTKSGHLYAVRVAYQQPVMISMKQGSEPVEALSSTFEDALVLENLALFRALDGHGLISKVGQAIETYDTPATLSEELHRILKTGSKAAFALDLLYSQEPAALKVPTYIAEGLTWLQEQLERKDIEFPSPVDPASDIPEAA